MGADEPMLIYNLFPLLAGRFSQWEPHLVRAAEMGFTWIFVNPIQRPGLSGSLYAVKDYHSFHPRLLDPASAKSPEDQLREAIRGAERLGLRVMVDLVTNHCAVDSDLVTHRPQWFLWEAPGRVAHPFAEDRGRKVVWGDLARFDHEKTSDPEGLFQYFLGVTRSLARLGFQGFRCDAAYQVPAPFWERLIEETRRSHPGVLFFAETLGCPPDVARKTAKAGFDYVFNSAKWWDFESPWLLKQYALMREIAPSVSFPESHDTPRLCEEMEGSVEGLKQRYLFTALFSAGVMMPMGFEFGFRKATHVVKTTPEDWEETGIDLRDFIRSVNRLKAGHQVLREESPCLILRSPNPRVLLLWKGSARSEDEFLLILNKDYRARQHFWIEDLRQLIETDGHLVDVSPEHAMDSLPAPFSYELRPGQGIVVKTVRARAERR
jgi:starch synthase (maltosyl-transferring)